MFSKKIEKLIRQAIQIASENNSKFRLAAIACDKNGRIISSGVNSTKTHPVQGKLDSKHGKKGKIFLHAEIASLVKARRQIYSLIVVRLLKDGNLGLASPCPLCREAISIAGIKEILYSSETGFVLEKLN